MRTKKDSFQTLLSTLSPKKGNSHKDLKLSDKTPSSHPISSHSEEIQRHETSPQKKGPLTRIIVKYDVGFNNSIYLRGEGADLSWDRGLMLKNVKADEWVWETNLSFNKCEFKVLINDRQYELGENHKLQCGTSFEYTPHFHSL